MSAVLFRWAAAIFIIVVVSLGIHKYFNSQKNAVSRKDLWAAYSSFFSEEICLERKIKPKFIDGHTRKSYVLECETSLTPAGTVGLYSEKLKKNGFTILFEGVGRDGILNVRGCNKGVIFAVYAANVDAKTIIEKRVLWASAEYRGLPHECKSVRR